MQKTPYMNSIKENRASQIQAKIDKLTSDLKPKPKSKLRIEVIENKTYLDGKLIEVTPSVSKPETLDEKIQNTINEEKVNDSYPSWYGHYSFEYY